MDVDLLRDRGRKIIRNEGLIAFLRRCIRFGYNISVRQILPTVGYRELNGVRFQGRKLFDTGLPWLYQNSDPDYEAAIISSIRRYVLDGDHVCVVGGGLGISTIVASRVAGNDGYVTTFEASAYRIKQIKRVIKLNSSEERIELNHALVGPGIRVQGEQGSPDTIRPSELPACDVLELDCEGAELAILRQIEFENPPHTIIVEVHPEFGSTESDVREELERMDYTLVDRVAEAEAKGVFVLTARRKPHQDTYGNTQPMPKS